LGTFDAWNTACIGATHGTNCPSPPGPDFDLGGSGPNLLPNLVGFGQKSGVFWALNPDTGSVVWSTIVGPGGTLGGIEWGSATDGNRFYAAISNNGHISYTLQPSGQIANAGSWSGLDVATGKIMWQTADPAGAIDPGSVSVANGVVYAGSYSGQMFALDAQTGGILWSFASGGSVLDGPAIVDSVLYWGSGYSRIRPGIGNNKLYAFSLPHP
jgi:polyvinyl alcohol dehydrogenase (cytochrome)